MEAGNLAHVPLGRPIDASSDFGADDACKHPSVWSLGKHHVRWAHFVTPLISFLTEEDLRSLRAVSHGCSAAMRGSGASRYPDVTLPSALKSRTAVSTAVDGADVLLRFDISGNWRSTSPARDLASLSRSFSTRDGYYARILWSLGINRKQAHGMMYEVAIDIIPPSLPSGATQQEASGSFLPSTVAEPAAAAAHDSGASALDSRSRASTASLDSTIHTGSMSKAAEYNHLLRVPAASATVVDISGSKRASPEDIASAIDAVAQAGRSIGTLNLSGCAMLDDAGADLVAASIRASRACDPAAPGAAVRVLRADRLPLLSTAGALALLDACFGAVEAPAKAGAGAGSSASCSGGAGSSPPAGSSGESSVRSDDCVSCCSSVEMEVGGLGALHDGVGIVELCVSLSSCTQVRAPEVVERLGKLVAALNETVETSFVTPGTPAGGASSSSSSSSSSSPQVRVGRLALGGCRGISDDVLVRIGALFPGIRELVASSRRRLGRGLGRRARARATATTGKKEGEGGLSSTAVSVAGVAELGRLAGHSLERLDLRGAVVAAAGCDADLEQRKSATRHFTALSELLGLDTQA